MRVRLTKLLFLVSSLDYHYGRLVGNVCGLGTDSICRIDVGI